MSCFRHAMSLYGFGSSLGAPSIGIVFWPPMLGDSLASGDFACVSKMP
jgi:hypothetical protein